MQGLRRSSDTRKASDSLGKLNLAQRSVQIIVSGASAADDSAGSSVTSIARAAETIAGGTETGAAWIADRTGDSIAGATAVARAAEKTAGVTKSAAAATRGTATAVGAVRSEDDSSAQAVNRASDIFAWASQRGAASTARGTAQLVRGGWKLTGKAVKGGIVAAQKRAGTAKAAAALKAAAEKSVTVSRAGATLARAGAAAAAAVKGMVAAAATAASSTPVVAIIIGVLAAILAILSTFSWLPGMTSGDRVEYGTGGRYPLGVTPGPWGGHDNGRIPENLLTPIAWATQDRLREDAAAALGAVNDKYKAEFGRDIAITDAYRDYDGQVDMREDWCARGQCANAAIPGTSPHGWALAVDLGGGINSFGTRQYQWMKSNAAKYGWQHPVWADPGGSAPEPWHWEFWGWAGSGGGGAVPDGDAQRYANQQLRAVFGPVPNLAAQFTCLQKLWMNESGWKHTAENPSSGAYGIPQALPADKMASAGADWRTNPKTQIDWGLRYIKERYETPCQAWDFWQSKNPHWY